MDNFDLKKFLKESKAIENLNPAFKSLNENEKKVDKDKEIKAKIKEMIIAEFEIGINNPDKISDAEAGLYNAVYEGEDEEDDETNVIYNYDEKELEQSLKKELANVDLTNYSEEDALKLLKGIFKKYSKDPKDLEEAKKKKDEDVENVEDVEVTDTTEEVPAEDMPTDEAPAATDGGLEDIAADMKGTEADLMDNLMKAFQIAKGMGNEKLETQVGNTLKFFVSEYIGGGEG